MDLQERDTDFKFCVAISILLLTSQIQKYLMHALHQFRQISFLVLRKFKQINYYFPWNHQKTYGILMISGGLEVN